MVGGVGGGVVLTGRGKGVVRSGKSSGRGITGEPKPARGRFAPIIYKEVFF